MLETMISGLNSGEQLKMNEATSFLENLKQNTNFWVHTKSIIQNTNDPNTIFFTLSALQEVISKKWGALEQTSQEQIRNFILESIINWCLIENPVGHVRLCINKMNSVLVEIVKREWRTTWKTALSDIINSSYRNENICANNLKILKELSGEIFDYERKNMTSDEIRELKNEFTNEFQKVYQLCSDVAKSYLQSPSSVNADLINICIETLHAFLGWVPPCYVLTTDLMDEILIKLLKEKKFIIKTLNCYEQVFKIPISDFEQDYNLSETVKMKLVQQFGNFLDILAANYKIHESLEINRLSLLKKEFRFLNYFNQTTQGFAMAISNFFTTHSVWLLEWIQQQSAFAEIVQKLKMGLAFMAAFTEVKDPILFKNCVDFWNYFLKNMNQDSKKGTTKSVLDLSEITFADIKREFSKPLSDMIMFLVMRVPKPQEIRIIIDEQGLPKKEELVDSENSMVYETVKEILRMYAFENYQTTKQIIIYKLETQVNFSDWSYDNLNSICWATGCLADLQMSADERNLFVNVLRILLSLCATKKSLEDKIVIAANIMHIVSQNHVYLKDISTFLGIVVKKLLEFADEKSDEICEMACNTLTKIAKELGPQFVKVSTGQDGKPQETLIEMVLELMQQIVPKMNIVRKIDFYEAVGYMIAAETNEQIKIGYLIRASSELERIWMNVCNNLTNEEFFNDIENANGISLFLRINANFCASIGESYKLYFDRCFQSLEQVYQNYYALICKMINQLGPQALGYSEMKKYRGVRKDILSLFQNFILIHKNNPGLFVANYGNTFNDLILIFVSETSDTKEAEVFDMISTALSILDKQSIPALLSSLPLILQSTLPMITQDFTSYPEVRIAFFGLLKSISDNCFEIFLALETGSFQTIINCLLWALRHEIMTIHEVGIEAINSLLSNINTNQAYMTEFYSVYYPQIFNEILFVTTDKMHQNGFPEQAKSLFMLLRIVNSFSFSLFGGNEDNTMQLYHHVLKIMSSEFRNLSQQSHELQLQKLFTAVNGTEKEFKVALKDYLISLNLHTGTLNEINNVAQIN